MLAPGVGALFSSTAIGAMGVALTSGVEPTESGSAGSDAGADSGAGAESEADAGAASLVVSSLPHAEVAAKQASQKPASR